MLQFSWYTKHISRDQGKTMAAKKAAQKKTASASGSDRGAKMKADAAQKKKQDKTASQLKIAPQRYSTLGDELMSTREYNSRRGDLSGNGLFNLGRLSQRGSDQAKRADINAAKKLAAKKLETAKKAKQKGR